MTQMRPMTIRHDVVVDAPVDRAFRVFTEKFGDFKPREHNLLKVPIEETVFEPRVGGHIYDRGVDGTSASDGITAPSTDPNASDDPEGQFGAIDSSGTVLAPNAPGSTDPSLGMTP